MIGSSSLLASFLIKRLPDKLTKYLIPKINDHNLTEVKKNRFVKMFEMIEKKKATEIVDSAKTAVKSKKPTGNDDKYAVEEAEQVDRDG